MTAPPGARFRVDLATADEARIVVLRPIEDGDEGLFAAEPAGSLQISRPSPAAAAFLTAGAEVRLFLVAGAAGPPTFGPHDALGIFFPDQAAKARALEVLRDARGALTFDERLAAVRRELMGHESGLDGWDPTATFQARYALELAWLAVKRAAGEISIEDPPATATQEPAPPAIQPASSPAAATPARRS